MAWIGVITNAGAALLANYAQGEHTLHITGASVGSGTVADANLRVQTAVSSEEDDASIVEKTAVTGGMKIKIQVGPAPTTAYTAHQIGIWAKLDSGASTLLALAQDAQGGVVVPAQSVTPAFAFALFLTVAVSNTGSIAVDIDEAAFLTIGTLNTALALKVDKTDIANNLTTTDEGKVLDARQGKALSDGLALKTTRLTFNATIPTSGWTLSDGLYHVTVSVTGILATDEAGGIAPVQTGTESTDKLIRKAWGKVVRIAAAANSITVYATAAATTQIPILLEVFR